MCILPFGHNLNALIVFRDAIGSHFSDSECLTCRDLPDYAEQGVNVQRILSYPYDGVVARAPKKIAEKRGLPKPLPERMFALINHPLPRKIFYTAVSEVFRIDLVRRRTRSDWRRVLRRFGITEADTIFMPSAEFYGGVALLDVLRALPAAKRPKVHFRMIGVSENARYSLKPARPAFLRSIRSALSAGIKLSVSAETMTYKTYLERVLDIPIVYLPYPVSNEQEPLNWGPQKTVTSPGQARGDKGIFRLVSIIQHLLVNTSLDAFRFDVQGMRVTDRDYRARYFEMLRNIPNMLLRPARLSQKEIDDANRSADIVVLPYDDETYALRGSAVYQEATAIGRPVVCSRAVGFSEQVLRYGNGYLADRDIEFAQMIRKLSNLPKTEVEAMVTKAREAYAADFDRGLSEVLKELTP